jgi:hypothetical protein
VLPPATSPPILTINEIVAPSEVASVKAELGGGLKLLCSEAPAGTSCASVAASNHVTTLDGAPAIWSQTSSSTQGEVGSAVTDIGNRVVQVAVIGESQAGVIAFKALSEVASVLASAP